MKKISCWSCVSVGLNTKLFIHVSVCVLQTIIFKVCFNMFKCKNRFKISKSTKYFKMVSSFLCLKIRQWGQRIKCF